MPVLVYAAMVLGSLSTSSLALLGMTPAGDGAPQLGESLPIRSDEWLTQAPIELSVLAHGSSTAPSLSQDPDLIYQVSSGGVVESVLFHEGNLLRLGEWLPDEMLFSAFRAWPWLLFVLALPPLLRRMGASRPLSWLAVVLTALAPAALWWSFMPIRIMAFAAAGSYLLWLARDRMVAGRRVTALLQAAVAGVLLARLVTYYVPWSLTVGVPLVIATGVYLVADRATRRPALLTIGAGAAVSLAVLAGTLLENAASLSAELNTVYPGLRRVTGAAQSPAQLFGAPGLFEMEAGPRADPAQPERDLLGLPRVRDLGPGPLASGVVRLDHGAARRHRHAGRGDRPLVRLGHGLLGRARRARAAAQLGAPGARRADGRLPGRAAAGPARLTPHR